MAEEMALIACIPVDTSGLPMQEAMPKPGIEHTLIKCYGCQQDCWIGPKQKEAADAGKGVALCYHCVLVGLAVTGSDVSVVYVNPDEKRIPRT